MSRIAAAALAIALSACSPTQYLITTSDGGQVISTGKPLLDDGAGVYTYTDANGRTSTLRRSEVIHVMPR